MNNLIHEIHRRSVWQVLAVYAVFAWLLFETFEVLRGTVGLPDWVEPAAATLLIVLLPALLATASIQRGRPAPWPRLVFREDAGTPRHSEPPAHPARSESAGESPADPRDAPPATGPAPHGDRRVARPPLAQRLFTWRNTLLGGVGAFLLLALATVGYSTLRSAGIGPAGTLVAQGTLDEEERLIVADFESPADMREMGQAITEGLRVDLAQSPVVRVHPQRSVSAALDRMEREPDEPLHLELAREVAEREAIRAVVAGELQRVGSRYVITAHVVRADDGSVLVSRRVTARDQEELVEAVDELSKGLRERIGEPLASIGRAEGLERVTTPDIEALRKYSSAVRAIDVEGEPDRGITLLEEAIALDSTFAMAWRKLGVQLGNRGEERRRVVEALTEAYRHRDRLSARERELAEAAYHTNVTGDLEAAKAAYQTLLEREPDDGVALNNLGDLHMRLREPTAALALFERALGVDTADVIPFMNLILARANLGRYEEAAGAEREYPWLIHDPTVRQHLAHVHAAWGRGEEAERRLRELRADEGLSPFWQRTTSAELGALAAAGGRLEEARAHYRDAMLSAADRGLGQQALIYAADWARIERFRGDGADAARAILSDALAAHPLEDFAPLDRPAPRLAQVMAQAGMTGQAEDLLTSFEADVPVELRGREHEIQLALARAELSLARGDPEAAVRLSEVADQGPCITCALPVRIRAFEAQGRPADAARSRTRYLDLPYLWRIRDTDAWFGPERVRSDSVRTSPTG